MLTKRAWVLHLIGDKASPAARDGSEVVRALNRRCYPPSRKQRAQLALEQYSILVGKNFHPGRSRGCCPVRATGSSLPCGRYLLYPFKVNLEGSKECVVPRVRPTPTRLSTSSLYTPMDNKLCSLYQVLDVRGAASADSVK